MTETQAGRRETRPQYFHPTQNICTVLLSEESAYMIDRSEESAVMIAQSEESANMIAQSEESADHVDNFCVGRLKCLSCTHRFSTNNVVETCTIQYITVQIR